MRLGIIFGGRSSEHEISLLSASEVIAALGNSDYELVYIGITKEGVWKRFSGSTQQIKSGAWEKSATHLDIGKLKEYIDFAFPVLHGRFGEDGTIQGLFEMLDMPYAGCNVLASSLAMDKAVAKEIFARAGLESCEHIFVEAAHFTEWKIKEEKAEINVNDAKLSAQMDAIEGMLEYPVFVKPVNMGSSVGISKAKDRETLEKGLRLAVKYDHRILVEAAVDARELEIGIIGNSELTCSSIGEILPSAEFYDYEAKYLDGGKSGLCIPADIDVNTRKTIEAMAKKAYEALDCAGLARLDFFLEKGTGKVLINEVNTMPGFTKISMFPLLFADAGVPYADLLERIIKFGYEKYYTKNNS